jgi:hypothetical protein
MEVILGIGESALQLYYIGTPMSSIIMEMEKVMMRYTGNNTVRVPMNRVIKPPS